MEKIYKNFVLDIILAVIALAAGIVMLPVFEIGQQLLNIVFAIVLLLYLVLSLFGKLKNSGGSLFILYTIEFAVVALIAIGLVLQQFNIFNITGVCSTVGLIIWLHGVLQLVHAYIKATSGAKHKYSMLIFLGYILLVSLGVYMFARPFITDEQIVWIISILFFVIAIACTICAIMYSPKKNTQKKPKKKETAKKSK